MSKITRFLKTSTIILGIASFGVATTTQAWADGRYRDRNHKEYRHDNRNKHGNHNKSRKHHKYKHQNYRHQNYRHHYSKPRYYGHVNYRYSHHRPRFHYGARGHGNDVALGILAGGLLVYGLTQAAQANNQPDVVYVPATQPAPAGGQGWATTAPAPQQVSYSHGTCLQEREYQTTITVGNETVPAYGTACLQPDGSWKFGPAKQVPAYAR